MSRHLSKFEQLPGKLGVRLAGLLAVALLPLAIVSIVRSEVVLSETNARAQAVLDGETLRAVTGELALIERAQGVAQAFAASSERLLTYLPTCQSTVAGIVESGRFSFAGYYDLSGDSYCNSTGDFVSFGMSPEILRQIENPDLAVQVNWDAPVSRTSIVFASAPVYGNDGTLEGFFSVSIPHRELEVSRNAINSDLNLMTVNRLGDVMTINRTTDTPEDLLPADLSVEELLASTQAFTTEARNGELRTYSVVPLVDSQLYAIGSWPYANERRQFYLSIPALFPALMWLASLAVAWFAVEVMVVRYIRTLRSAMVQFSVDRKMIALDSFENAPNEIRDVAATYAQLTDTMMRDEAVLENTVYEKEILLREVHHRVKNNLQLIASIMNMQMRQSRSAEVKALMRNLHDRVMSLATIHRGLYQTSGLAQVRADELLPDILTQIIRMSTGSGADFALETDFDPISLTPDQAVPLALLLTEALTNVMKYGGARDGGKARLRVSLKKLQDNQASLSIANTMPSTPVTRSPEEMTGLGNKLLSAFAQQLGGVTTQSEADGWYDLSVVFTVEQLRARDEGELDESFQPSV